MKIQFSCLLILLLLASCHPALQPEKRKGQWGYQNKKGEFVIKPAYQSASQFEGKFAIVSFLVEKYDSIWIPPQFGDSGYWNVDTYEAERFTYINRDGETFNLILAEARPFQNGLAAARVGPQWGFINEAGEWAIEPGFVKVSDFEKGKAAVIIEKEQPPIWYKGVIDKSGELVGEMSAGERKPDSYDSIAYETLIASGEIYIRLTDYSSAYDYLLAAARSMDQIEREDTLAAMKLSTTLAWLSAMRLKDENYEHYDSIARVLFERNLAHDYGNKRMISLEYIEYLVELAEIRSTNLQLQAERECLERTIDAVERSGENRDHYWDIEERLKEMEEE